jgi:three-Cys-motif partner protein
MGQHLGQQNAGAEVPRVTDGAADHEAAPIAEHVFGGPWTQIKLDAVEYYLRCYTTALGRRPFDLWYIDSFAGTGEQTVDRLDGGLFDGRPIGQIRETLAGSARRALAVEPPFHHFIFIEDDPERCVALEQLRSENPSKDIRVIEGDANNVLRRMIARDPWSKKDKGTVRGVVFLDPYALHVEWSTLTALAQTN